MDSIISSALEEICSSGPKGISLLNLWPRLHPALTSAGLDLCAGVKKAVWSNLITTQGLQFEPRDDASSSIDSVAVAEKRDLVIAADENLRDCFVGLYDLKAREGFKGLSVSQRRTLERLALARSNGITQSELGKEFGMEGNEIFYVLKHLECQGLIVRQSTVVRRKGVSNERDGKNSSAVTTNMIYLSRYATHLESHQRLEITKEDEYLESLGNTNVLVASGDISGECLKADVHVKDFLPALKAICDKLEEATGKVLVVSDIKLDLGYRHASGHRAWRNICQRLRDAHVVEEFMAKVNNKVVPCLRLLKMFSPSTFEAKTPGYRNDNAILEHAVSAGKRGLITDQVVELPIEHKIYDMIDAAGSKGLTIIEMCKMLGICSKRYYSRLLSMFSRFGMHLKPEVHNRGVVYRVWTSRNFNVDPSAAFPSTSENAKKENGSHPQVEDPYFHEDWALTVPEVNPSTSKEDDSTRREMNEKETMLDYSHGSREVDEYNSMPVGASNSHELVHVSSCSATDAALDLVSVPAELNVSPHQTSLHAPMKPEFIQRYPCRALTDIRVQREKRILEKLQEEKFIVRAELQRWLESFEKDTSTTMDSKTLIRILNKLQQQGQCKCINVSVPVVTNCGNIRTKEVVLHPSFQNLTPGLLSQIHDKLRSFEMQSRGHGLSRLKEDLSAPALNGIQKIHNTVVSDSQTIRTEAMRANGFVLAKMVRAKLLHSFLWNYLSSSPGWDDAFSSGLPGYDMNNPHSTCKLFALDVAIKAIPLELFLQVVGSAAKFDDLIGKCKSGLRLSDLPVVEYKSLMDTLATGRLSWLVDTLRRLKLIRLVSNANSEGDHKVQHTTFKHAMELKPYIEEPRTIFLPSSGNSSLDLRPQIRHDFTLLKREAVDDYWRTLEYCYSAADHAAALHAFPGSTVHEVFFHKSWASVRVMKAEQRAELFKRVVEVDPNKKLSLRECEKIAKDLNLTLQQVLRVYYDRRSQRLNRFQGGHAEGNRSRALKRKRNSSSRKRRSVSDGSSLNNFDGSVEKFCKQKLAHLSDMGNQFTKQRCRLITSSKEQDVSPKHDHLEDMGDPVPSEEEDNSSFRRQLAFSGINQTRRKKIWTEEADRKLIIQYVKHRAMLGANFHRAEWTSLPDLPAPPDSCKRRMALLNRNTKFRKSLMKLCNMLGERYAKHLDKAKNSEDSEYLEQWDNFDDNIITMALDAVLQNKRMIKFQSSREDSFGAEDLSNLNVEADAQHAHESELVGEEIQTDSERQSKEHDRRSSSHRLPLKYTKHLNDERTVSKRVYESLAVSNAVELLKLIFLNTSTAAEVPNLLAETLRRYSEHDLFASFSYLREKKIMIGGCSGNSFSLSQRFVHNISSSPFQPNTGKRAHTFSRWLQVNKALVEEEGINLTQDLQCGDIFHLFALVSLGELSITPCLPDEGVGDIEDLKSLKRKADNAESCTGNEPKKQKLLFCSEGEIISRREKGFPGLMVSLRANAVDFLLEKTISKTTPSLNRTDKLNTTFGEDAGSSSSFSDNLIEDCNFTCTVPPATWVSNESLWEAMTSYAKHLILPVSGHNQLIHIYPELLRTVCTAIEKAGDQGLTLEQVSELVDVQGKETPRLIIDVLEAFGQVLKVNSYSSVHVVNYLYCSKYFLTSLAGLKQELQLNQVSKSRKVRRDVPLNPSETRDASRSEIGTKSDSVHRVTILNLTEEISQSVIENKANHELEGCTHDMVVSPGGGHKEKARQPLFGNTRCVTPILPWINGDGSINKIIYRGLVRRVLGIVMQNPGILEDDIIRRIDTLNPQNCRKLLELMILDKHVIVRKMHQTTSGAPPALMASLLGKNIKATKSIYREHFFANPLSTTFL